MTVPRSVKRVLYFNTSFDAELARACTDRIRRLSAEMSVYALVSARIGESALCDASVDDSYLEYLRGLNFAADPAVCPDGGTEGVAWGWSERSLSRLESRGCMCDHPPLETVKKVNGRKFGIDVAKSIGVAYAGEAVDDAHSLRDIVKRMRMPVLIKPLHGSSGRGHAVINDPDISVDELTRIISAHPPGVSVEPFFDRIEDFAVNFYLGKDGTIRDLSFHQCVTDNRGIFRGIKLRSDDDFISRWIDRVMESVAATAGALHGEGYFGHAGIDLFTFRDKRGAVDIHPLCEINARRTMGDVARACKMTLGGRLGLLRQVPSARCGSMRDLASSFGNHSYDRFKRSGICVISPETLRFDGMNMRPALVMLYAAADTEEDLLAMEETIEQSTIRKRHR